MNLSQIVLLTSFFLNTQCNTSIEYKSFKTFRSDLLMPEYFIDYKTTGTKAQQNKLTCRRTKDTFNETCAVLKILFAMMPHASRTKFAVFNFLFHICVFYEF